MTHFLRLQKHGPVLFSALSSLLCSHEPFWGTRRIFPCLPVASACVTAVPISSRENGRAAERSEEHTSELQSRQYLVCRLLLEKKKRLDVYIMSDVAVLPWRGRGA